MAKCTDTKRIYEDMEFCEGQKSLPGIRSYIYAIRKADIVTWPKPQGSAATDLDGVAVIKEDFTLAASAKWLKIEIVPNDGKISNESQGSFGAKTFKNSLEIDIPGTKERATGFIAQANNDSLVFLSVDRNGQARLFGDEGFDVELALSQDSGQGATDTAQTKIVATVDSEFPMPFYHGKIFVGDYNISGQDGSATAAEGA